MADSRTMPHSNHFGDAWRLQPTRHNGHRLFLPNPPQRFANEAAGLIAIMALAKVFCFEDCTWAS